MKTKEELNALKEEVENLNKKLAELPEDELAQVTGGSDSDAKYICRKCGEKFTSLSSYKNHSMLVHFIWNP